ncbi:MAG TPA: DAK2 domain-containing protein [Nocardioidaceae bacterium]|nr:DAK2 domain-containing protein [Nocardioidaceae bacterium]
MTRGDPLASRPVACLNKTGWRAFLELAERNLAAAREEIDALNVYPVRDRDTGTNMFLTVQAAHAGLREAVDAGRGDRQALTASARGALLGARGSSGVIVSQLIGALVRHVGDASSGLPPAEVLAGGLAAASAAGYAAVGDPVEGTILSVAKAASQAAVAAATRTQDVGEVLAAAAAAAREALEHTPEQLSVLAEAGVVDAGGRGLCLILDAAESVVTGRRTVSGPSPLGSRGIPAPRDLAEADLHADGPAYEVMYLLDADDSVIPPLRETLSSLGDSLVVVGGEGLWNVHVHVDDVGAAVEAGIATGRPHRLRVTHFAEQARHETRARPPTRTGRAVFAVPAGPGLRRLFADAGAHVLRPKDRALSAAEIVTTLRATGAAELVVLPNDRKCTPAVQAAVQTLEEEDGARAVVIETTNQVQGLAALAVHEPARPFDTDVLEMTAAARHTRSGAVTVATRRAITMAGPCEEGDVLGVVEGDFAVVGDDMFCVAVQVLDRLLGGGGELVTVLAGEEGRALAERCVGHLTEQHPTVDVVCYDGGQERYPLLLGVE